MYAVRGSRLGKVDYHSFETVSKEQAEEVLDDDGKFIEIVEKLIHSENEKDE